MKHSPRSGPRLRLLFLAIVIGLLISTPLAPIRAQLDDTNPTVRAIVDAAMANLSQKLGKTFSRSSTPWFIEEVVTNDASLDCPAPGKTYPKRTARSYRLRITAPSQADPRKNFDYIYRAMPDGSQLFECTPQGQGPNVKVVLPIPPTIAATGTAAATVQATATRTKEPAPQPLAVVNDSRVLWPLPARPNVTVVGNPVWSSDGSKLLGLVTTSGKNPSASATAESTPPGGAFEVIDLITGNALVKLPLNVTPVNSQFSPNGKQIAVLTSDGQTSLFDLESGKLIANLTRLSNITATQIYPQFAWNSDGSRIALLWIGQLAIWNARNGQSQFSGAVNVSGSGLQWSPDGTQLLAGYGTDASPDQAPVVIDAATGKSQFTLNSGKSQTLKGLLWGPNGRSIATLGKDGMISLFQSTNGSRVRNLKGNDLKWSPDGKSLILATDVRSVNIYDTATAKVTSTLPSGVASQIVLYSPDGKRIAAADSDGAVRVWDAATGKLLLQLNIPNGAQSGLRGLLWKADGTQLITFGQIEMRLWSLPAITA